MNSFESGVSNAPETTAEHQYEVMKTPEIVVQEERGAQLFSLLLKAENPDWGETETPLAKEVTEYFHDNPIPENIRDAIRGLHEQGVDEETLYNVALTYQHPERAEHVVAMAEKYKPHVSNPKEVQQKLTGTLDAFDQFFSTTPLATKIDAEIEKDRNMRTEQIRETEERIKSLIDFYKPDSGTTDMRKVSFVPTDPMYRKNSGRAFGAFPGEHIIISHIDNLDNQDHEFSHGIINPIVEKLSRQLTEEERQKVSELASEGLKQDYGEGHFNLLCEEFIRTYNDVLKRGEQPQTYDQFMLEINELTEDQFKEYTRESKSLQKKLEGLGIQTLEDFKNKSKEFYKQFKQNRLRDLVFNLYQEYKDQQDSSGENFEQFVLKNFQDKLRDFEQTNAVGAGASYESQTVKPEKPPVLFHASQNPNIETFEPRANKVRDEHEGPKVFATPSRAVASMFLVEADDSWVQSGAMDGQPYIVISDEQRFRDVDHGGTVYSLPNETFENDPEKGLRELEWTSSEPVKPTEAEHVSSAVEDMIKHGVKVFFVGQGVWRAIKESDDGGESIVKNLTPASM